MADRMQLVNPQRVVSSGSVQNNIQKAMNAPVENQAAISGSKGLSGAVPQGRILSNDDNIGEYLENIKYQQSAIKALQALGDDDRKKVLSMFGASTQNGAAAEYNNPQPDINTRANQIVDQLMKDNSSLTSGGGLSPDSYAQSQVRNGVKNAINTVKNTEPIKYLGDVKKYNDRRVDAYYNREDPAVVQQYWNELRGK